MCHYSEYLDKKNQLRYPRPTDRQLRFGNPCGIYSIHNGYDGLMLKDSGKKRLLSIIELGGYPNFTPLYEDLGFEVEIATRMRKALGILKNYQPDVIVTEFNFASLEKYVGSFRYR